MTTRRCVISSSALLLTLALMAMQGGCDGKYSASNDNNTNTAADCGNGVIDSGEQCDGSALAGETCERLGFTGGALGCGGDCRRDVSECEIPEGCGNGVLDPGEACDGVNLGGQDCSGLGYEGGSLGCTLACRFETGSCQSAGVCGDDVANPPGEACDGVDLAGQTCFTMGYDDGTLSCDGGCQFDVAGCTSSAICGDSQLGPGEACDGMALGGATCVSQGFDGGTLVCSAACNFDTTGCTIEGCGDGVIALGEECDGTNFGGVTCESLGFTGGQLLCSGTCRLDTSACTLAENEICTNGIDDDGNGQCDCLDAACVSNAICLMAGVETNCADGVDNDHDCLVDCADSDCLGDPACAAGACTPHQSVTCGSVVSGTTVGGPMGYEVYPNTCASIPDSGPEAYFLLSNIGGLLPTQVSVNLTATTNADLELIVVGVSGTGCDVQGACITSSQTPGGVETAQFMAQLGAMYYVIVDGYNGAADSFTLSINCP